MIFNEWGILKREHVNARLCFESQSGDLKSHDVKKWSQRTESGVYAFYLAIASFAAEIIFIISYVFGLKLLAFDNTFF